MLCTQRSRPVSEDMLFYMTEIRDAAHQLAQERWGDIFENMKFELECLKESSMIINPRTRNARGPSMVKRSLSPHSPKRKSCTKVSCLASRQLQTINVRIPVLGFCFNRYDLNLVEERLLLHLDLDQSCEVYDFVIKNAILTFVSRTKISGF